MIRPTHPRPRAVRAFRLAVAFAVVSVPLGAGQAAHADHSPRLVRAFVFNEKRDGFNKGLVIQTRGTDLRDDEVSVARYPHPGSRATPTASPDALHWWVVEPRDDESRGLLRDIARRLRRHGSARFHAVIKPHGADEGNFANFRITGYRKPARARYPN